jgi:hypothetical protein
MRTERGTEEPRLGLRLRHAYLTVEPEYQQDGRTLLWFVLKGFARAEDLPGKEVFSGLAKHLSDGPTHALHSEGTSRTWRTKKRYQARGEVEIILLNRMSDLGWRVLDARAGGAQLTFHLVREVSEDATYPHHNKT